MHKIKSIKRGRRVYEVVKIEKNVLVTKHNGQEVRMDLPLRICFPHETFWCVENDVNLGELEKIYQIG